MIISFGLFLFAKLKEIFFKMQLGANRKKIGKSGNECLYSCYKTELSNIIVRERIQSVWSYHSNRKYSFFYVCRNLGRYRILCRSPSADFLIQKHQNGKV